MAKLYTTLFSRVMDLRDREEGQTFVEYGVLVGVIAIALIVILGTFEGNIAAVFNKIGSSLGGF